MWWTFPEYLAESERYGWPRREALSRLLSMLQAASARAPVRGIKREAQAPDPEPDAQRRQWRAERRRHDLARWLSNDEDPAMYPPWNGRELFCRYHRQRPRKLSTERRAALSEAWKRQNEIVEEAERWAVQTDLAPHPVPQWIWERFEGVADDLTCEWVDDPDEPESSSEVDWPQGRAGFYATGIGWHLEFTNLEVLQTLAVSALSWSEAELRTKALAWPGRDGTAFAKHVYSDPRGRRFKEKDIRDRIWPDVRNQARKKGRPPKARA